MKPESDYVAKICDKINMGPTRVLKYHTAKHTN